MLQWLGGAYDPEAFAASDVKFDDPTVRWRQPFFDSCLQSDVCRMLRFGADAARTTMKLHILSDLHTEFADFVPSETEAEAVILAGDIGVGVEGVR